MRITDFSYFHSRVSQHRRPSDGCKNFSSCSSDLLANSWRAARRPPEHVTFCNEGLCCWFMGHSIIPPPRCDRNCAIYTVNILYLVNSAYVECTLLSNSVYTGTVNVDIVSVRIPWRLFIQKFRAGTFCLANMVDEGKKIEKCDVCNCSWIVALWVERWCNFLWVVLLEAWLLLLFLLLVHI